MIYYNMDIGSVGEVLPLMLGEPAPRGIGREQKILDPKSRGIFFSYLFFYSAICHCCYYAVVFFVVIIFGK